MYSSCPTILKHFVPIKFSLSSLDNRYSPALVEGDTGSSSMPLTNIKLQCLKSKPKDFVLIFKNSSFKDYTPKKQVTYSPVLKSMRTINRQAIEAVDIFDRNNAHVGGRKPGCSIDRRSQTPASEMLTRRRDRNTREYCQSAKKVKNCETELRKNYTAASKKRLNLSTKNSSVRDSGKVKFLRDNQDEQNRLVRRTKIEAQSQEIGKLMNFKLKGRAAPKSETVDFFKKLNLDLNFHIADKIFK